MFGLTLLIMLTSGLLVLAAVLLLMGSRRSVQSDIDWRARISGEALPIEASRRQQPSQDPLLGWIINRLHRAGLEFDAVHPRRIVVIGLIGFALIWLLVSLIAAILVLAVTLVVTWLWLMRRAAARRRRILDQLPDFLEYMLRALSAGNSLEESLYSATADSDEPIRGLFLSVARQVRLGAPIDDVLDQIATEHDLPDIRVMALAARVSRRYGGSLKRIFKSLIQAIRERDSAARELRALTAETRFSAVVLAVVPLMLSFYILLQNPDYYLDMWAQASGRTLLILSMGLQLTGVLVIWRMLKSAEEYS